MSTKIETIKQNYTIRQLAEGSGAQPNNRGICKHNPLRTEKTSSLVIYDDTNSWNDFGGIGGDVITYFRILHDMDMGDAIESMLRDIGKSGSDFDSKPHEYVPIPTVVTKKYMTDAAVYKAFNSMFNKNINHTDHNEVLETIAPRYLYDEAEEIDYNYFFEHVKYNKGDNTAIVLLRDEKGEAHTFRYRNKMIGDNLKKWVALAGTRADYLYCRLNDNRITLIVEGTRDFLTALLCGYSVIALPRANYDNIPPEILADRLCVFIDDDDGKGFMTKLSTETICEKVIFNHPEFKKITKCKSKDFSDYTYKFKHLSDFKDAFEKCINSSATIVSDWKSCIAIDSHVSLDFLENAPKVESLIENFIYKGTASVIHASPGAGKSTFVLAMAKKLLNEKKISSVLYFDADNPMSVIKDRVSKLKKEFGDDLLYFTTTTSGVKEMKEQLTKLCLFRDGGVDTLIVVDTLAKFVEGSVNNDNEVKPILDLICEVRDKFRATSLIIHHSNKAKDEDGRNIFRGSQMIKGDTDATWGLQRKGNLVTIQQDKVRFSDMYDTIETEIDSSDLTFGSFKGKYASEIEEEIDDSVDVVDMVHKYILENEEVSTKEILSGLKGKAGQNKIHTILKDKAHKKVLWYNYKLEGSKNTWVYKGIPKVEAIEYEMTEEEIEGMFA